MKFKSLKSDKNSQKMERKAATGQKKIKNKRIFVKFGKRPPALPDFDALNIRLEETAELLNRIIKERVKAENLNPEKVRQTPEPNPRPLASYTRALTTWSRGLRPVPKNNCPNR